MREFRRLVVAVSCDDLEPGLIFLSHSVCHAYLLLVDSLLRIIALGSLLMVIMGSGLLPGIHMIWVSLHFSSATFGSRLMSKELGHGGVALFWGVLLSIFGRFLLEKHFLMHLELLSLLGATLLSE